MYVQLQNENYGYATATYGDYVAVGNPIFLRYDKTTSPTTYYSGSIDYFRYNKSTDQHDLVGTLFVRGYALDTLLATETPDPLHTEDGGTYTADKDLFIDRVLYLHSLEDGFGVSLDMYGKLLVAGSPYYSASFITQVVSLTVSGSEVDIFDLERTENDTNVDPYVYTLENPHPEYSESFGHAVAINSEWIAVGSPYVSSSKGVVYLYQNDSTGSGHYTWSLFQTITSSNPSLGQRFGHTVKLNKQSGGYSGSMVVGCGLTSSNEVYYFEFVSGSWIESYTFRPTSNILPLTFGTHVPYQPTMSLSNSFGHDVSLYDSTVVIGAYADRTVYEYTGSSLYEQGAVYIFEKCPNRNPTDFYLALKTYGTALTLKNNHLGFSVDTYGGYVLAGSPKSDLLEIIPCYVQGTLGQLHYCDQDLENTLNGQVLLLQKNTASLEWEIVNVYQKKKRFLSPHRNFGQDVSIGERSMVVGAPIFLSGSKQINIPATQSAGVELDDVTGKAYIYNLTNLREEFHVGNVFYRNGKIIIMTSGSAFDGLFSSQAAYRPYEYDLIFKGQRTIQEKQVICNVEPGEFNVSTNPTAIVLASSSLDLNKNGIFDFQDVDVLLRYIQYTLNKTTDWSSSLVTTDDEKSFLAYNQLLWTDTPTLWSSSFNRFENNDTTFVDILDANYDGRVDKTDMAILWKYFSHRLTDHNYAGYINTNCQHQQVTEAMDYLDFLTKRKEVPQIDPTFFEYERLTAADKTGSFLAPMVTTIGLYDGLDLVAVAKLGAPIKLPKTLPINFIIKIDF